MSDQKTNSENQQKLDLDSGEEAKLKSSTLEIYPDIFSLMFKNKDAINNQKKKDHFKRKYGK